MLLRETLDRLKRHNTIQVFATDLDAQAIGAARVGLYPDGICADIRRERLGRFFTSDASCYRIRKDIRETVIFAEQNLINDPPFTRLDLISCRNLLIYFKAGLQKQLLPLFHYALRPGGLLVLGTSETIGGFTDLFRVADSKWKIFERKTGSAVIHAITGSPTPTVAQETDHALPPAIALGKRPPTIAELSSTLLAERYAPPSAIVNERGDILFIHGQSRALLAASARAAEPQRPCDGARRAAP